MDVLGPLSTRSKPSRLVGRSPTVDRERHAAALTIISHTLGAGGATVGVLPGGGVLLGVVGQSALAVHFTRLVDMPFAL